MESEAGVTRSERFHYRPAWGVIALVILFVALFAWSELRLRAMREELSQTEAALASLSEERTRLAASNEKLAAELKQLGDASRSAELPGKGSASGAHARYFLDPDGKSAIVVLGGLPPASQGQRYHLWVTRVGAPAPEQVATFAAVAGRAVRVTVKEAEAPLQSLRVTVGPAASKQADGEEVFAATF